MSYSAIHSIEQTLQLARYYHRLGELDQAAQLCQHVLQKDADNSESLHLLAMIAIQTQHYEQAHQLVNQAIERGRPTVEYYITLGIALKYQNKLEQAIESYQRALLLNPDSIEASYNLAIIFSQQRRFDEAVACYQRVLALNPQVPQAHNNLANIYKEQGQLAQAVAHYAQAIRLHPDYLDAHNNLAIVLNELGEFNSAIHQLQSALRINSNDHRTLFNLANLLHQHNRLTEAENVLRQCVELETQEAKIYVMLGVVLSQQGKPAQAMAYYRQALTQDSHYVAAHSNILFTMNYLPGYSRLEIYNEYQKFNQQHALPLASSLPQPINLVSKRIKLGYVSPDFRQHSLAYFITPLFTHYNHEKFEVFCYYTNNQYDKITAQLQCYPDHWIDCADLDDAKLAETIHQENIDILVDLAGHTDKNRLLTFARKPAPIQITAIGYPDTTGLTSIDYRLTDNFLDPQEGNSQSFNAERLIHMPHSFFCYRPIQDAPPVNELPAINNGYITFGFFNNYVKLTIELQNLWIQILTALPTAKLLLKTSSFFDPTIRQECLAKFSQAGIEENRILLEPTEPIPTYLASFHRVDLALDSFPFNGGTMTCETLWMGVPVITLVGERSVSRMGLSILSTVGLTESITYSPEEYVNTAIQLAQDIQWLTHCRKNLRDKMRASALMDEISYTRALENLLFLCKDKAGR